MENMIKLNCTNTTYVCNFRPNINYCKEEKLFVGAITDSFKNLNVYTSLLRFNISDKNISISRSAYLFIYLENTYPSSSKSIEVSVYGDDKGLNVSDINWETLPDKNTHIKSNLNIPTKSTKKYLRIDISNIIKSLNPNANTYDIIIEPMNLNKSSMLQFSSESCINPPYLVLVKDISDDLNNEKSSLNDFEAADKNENEKTSNDTEDFNMEESVIEIINELNSQNLRFDSFEENLANIITSFDTITSTIKDNTTEIENKLDQNFSDITNNINSLKGYVDKLGDFKKFSVEDIPIDFLNNLTSDLNELTKNEISQLKNSVNYDILELKNSINNITSSLNNSIKEMTESLSFLSNKITKISTIMDNIIIEPLDKTSL